MPKVALAEMAAVHEIAHPSAAAWFTTLGFSYLFFPNNDIPPNIQRGRNRNGFQFKDDNFCWRLKLKARLEACVAAKLYAIPKAGQEDFLDGVNRLLFPLPENRPGRRGHRGHRGARGARGRGVGCVCRVASETVRPGGDTRTEKNQQQYSA